MGVFRVGVVWVGVVLVCVCVSGSVGLVRHGFIKIRMKLVNFIKKIFIKNHFHQKPLSSEPF